MEALSKAKLLLGSLIVVLGTCAAIGVPVTRADDNSTDIELTKLQITRTTQQAGADPTQAGGHPNVALSFQFCGQGVPIVAATRTSPIQITTSVPVTPGTTPSGYPTGFVRNAQGLTAANGNWKLQPVGTSGDTFALLRPNGTPSDGTNSGEYVAGSAKLRANDVPPGTAQGCTQAQGVSYIKDFTLHLPRGFLGNPTATVACAEPLWLASTCPPETRVGFSWTPVLQSGTGATPSILFATSPVYNVQTLGLQPALLGTVDFPSDPPGPFPISISVRSTGDRGIDSTLINIPRNLGGFLAAPIEINTVLCGRVPTCGTDVGDTGDTSNARARYDPNAVTRPFFVNPTSCAPQTASLEARSWKTHPVTSTVSTDFETTGCDKVPFDLGFDVDPAADGTNKRGAPSAQSVVLEYPRETSCPAAPVEPDCWYENEDIWQAQLKEIAQTLPDGLSLSPGGGVGLEGCSYDQFGVDSSGKQLNDDPVQCPQGSQIGTLTVRSPVIANPVGGSVFFGPTSGRGRPTADHPWKLFLLIEGSGLRIKLAGDVIVGEDGSVSNVFVNQPELPFGQLELHLNGGAQAPLMNPSTCGIHNGSATLTGWNDKVHQSTPSMKITADGDPNGDVNSADCTGDVPFNPAVEEATATPKTAGANSVSKIILSRPDGSKNIRNIKLSLPAGAVGSLAAVPKCQLADARAGNCPTNTRIGTVKNTVGNGDGLLTAEGGLFLAEASQPGDAASIVIDVPAKSGPIDLGDVILISRVVLRSTDTGVDVFTNDIPKIFGGVPLPLRKIEITVDRPGFFLNPTGCEPRPLIATFDAWEGGQTSSSMNLQAEDCDKLPFNPQLRLIAGGPGLTGKGQHPPLTAIVTQQPGEANIKLSKTVLPDILRPNSPVLNEPGGLCAEAQFVLRQCPDKSLVGNARAISPVLPFELSGPVYIVQQTVDPLPRLYVLLRGGGFEVPLKARSFFTGIRTTTLFDNTIPDVPNSYFELNINGGSRGILNNWTDLCKSSPRAYDQRFTGQNGKTVDSKPLLEINGCDDPRVGAAGLMTKRVKVKGGKAKLAVKCHRTVACKGRLSLRTSGKVRLSRKSKAKTVALGRRGFTIPAGTQRTVTVSLSKAGKQVVRKYKRVSARATVSVTGADPAVSSLQLRR